MRNAIIGFFRRIFKRLKQVLHDIYHARGSAHEIAFGAAIGAFWGVFPTFGLSTILTLLLYRFLRFNLVVAISAAFISNPLTSPFLLWASYAVGDWLIGASIAFDADNWLDQLPQLGYALFVGSALVSSATALVVYYSIRTVVQYRRRNKESDSQAGESVG
jgi:hypothetical protein